jgi:hypothetical protein
MTRNNMNTQNIVKIALVGILLLQPTWLLAMPQQNNCPLKMVTSAYLDYKFTTSEQDNYGEIYQVFMDKVLALQNSKNFKNLEVVSQTLDIQNDFNNDKIKTATIRVTIEFDLNYKAVSEISKNIQTSSLMVSTYEMNKCSSKKEHS